MNIHEFIDKYCVKCENKCEEGLLNGAKTIYCIEKDIKENCDDKQKQRK